MSLSSAATSGDARATYILEPSQTVNPATLAEFTTVATSPNFKKFDAIMVDGGLRASPSYQTWWREVSKVPNHPRIIYLAPLVGSGSGTDVWETKISPDPDWYANAFTQIPADGWGLDMEDFKTFPVSGAAAEAKLIHDLALHVAQLAKQQHKTDMLLQYTAYWEKFSRSGERVNDGGTDHIFTDDLKDAATGIVAMDLHTLQVDCKNGSHTCPPGGLEGRVRELVRRYGPRLYLKIGMTSLARALGSPQPWPDRISDGIDLLRIGRAAGVTNFIVYTPLVDRDTGTDLLTTHEWQTLYDAL